MNHAAILSLKALLVALIAVLLASQIWVIPEVARQSALQHPEIAYLQLPGILIAIVFVLCVQLSLICTWQLLTLVRVSTIFSQNAFKWVDAILWLVIGATLLILASFITLTVVGISSPTSVMCVLGLVLGASFALLVVVMRGLLHKASQLEQDLAEVV